MTCGETRPGAEALVWIIDPDPISREMCRTCLENAGYEVETTSDNGTPATGRSPDVVVVNAAPGSAGAPLDGPLASMKLDLLTDGAALLVMGDPVPADAPAFDHLVDDYIARPVQPEELVPRVRAMCRLRHARRDGSRERHLRAEQARLWNILLDLSNALAAEDSVDTILDQITQAAAELSCSRRVSIMLPDDRYEHLIIRRAIGIDEDVQAQVRLPIGDAVAGRVFLSEEQVFSIHRENESRQSDRYESAVFASIPVMSHLNGPDGSVVAVLNMTDRFDDRPFEAWELDCIDLLGNIAGSALHSIVLRQARQAAHDSVVIALATLAEYRDNETGYHVERVMQFSLMIAAELKKNATYADEIDESFLRSLRRSAPLHDIGKVAVPDGVLLKPGSLNPQEMALIRTHAATGRKTIRSVIERMPETEFLRMAADVAGSHHEWHDGSGYPCGLAADHIPLAARIVAVADVYDAVTSRRVYKAAVPHADAVRTIRDARGTQFNPDVVDAFLACEGCFARVATELADDDSLFLCGGRRETKGERKCA